MGHVLKHGNNMVYAQKTCYFNVPEKKTWYYHVQLLDKQGAAMQPILSLNSSHIEAWSGPFWLKVPL